MESQKAELYIEIESRVVVARVWGSGEKWGDVDQGVQSSSYKMNKYWGSNIQHGNYT